MSRPGRLLSLLSAAWAIVLFASCAPPVVRPTAPLAPYVDAREAVTALEARTAIGDVSGTVTLKTYDRTDSLTNSVTGYLAFKYPDKVRFTYIGPLGIVLFEALVNDKTTVLFLPQQLTAYKGTSDKAPEGPFSPKLMAMPFRKPLGPIFVIEHDGPRSTLYCVSEKAGTYELVEKIVFDRSTMRPLVREEYEKGLPVYRIRYLAYDDLDGVDIPTEMTLEDLTSGSSMGITLRDFKVNAGLADEAFDTTVKPPYVVKPLDSFELPDY